MFLLRRYTYPETSIVELLYNIKKDFPKQTFLQGAEEFQQSVPQVFTEKKGVHQTRFFLSPIRTPDLVHH